MNYKDMLVFLDAGNDTESRVDQAIALCQQFNARLTGVDVSTPEAYGNEYAERAVRLEEMFTARLEQASLTGTYRVAEKRTASWKDFYAHYTDLVVATQREESTDPITAKEVPDGIVMSAGVPVLVLPPRWRNSALGESVVLAWNASRESTRAMHDALPFLRRASRVTIFEFAPPADDVDSAPDLVREHLSHHGVNSEIFTWPDVRDISPMDALFSCLDRQQADLIVAGAFGHSSLMESLLGSASDDLLHNPSVPVLMSH